jgi:hypothetical protein
MKKVFICIATLAITSSFGQAFDGYGDGKLSLGLTTQSGATGLEFATDKGLSDFLSYGAVFGFAFSSDNKYSYTDPYSGQTVQGEITGGDSFSEKIDFHFRLDGHFGKMLGLSDMQDVAGGINVGTRNIGLHAAYKYFITDGFGFYADMSIPFVKYRFIGTEKVDYFNYYNQPVFGIGIIFNN